MATWAGIGTNFLWKSNAVTSDIYDVAYLSTPDASGLPPVISGGVYGIELDIPSGITPDTAPPTTTSWASGTLGTNDWYTGPVTVKIAATDVMPGTGVASTLYRIDGGGWLPYVSAFTISPDGVHEVDFYSTDNAGNAEATHTQSIKIDQTPPTTAATLSGPLGNNGWYVGTVTVALPASDNLSGVALTQYCLDGGAMQTYTGSFNISSDGVHSVHFYSTDNAGNVEATHTQTITVDETKPVLAAATDPSTLWPPNGKMVTVNVSGKITDNLSGVDPAKGTYAVSDEYGLVQPSGTFSVNADGTYSFTIQLEARRDGQDKDGRIYTIIITDLDQAGNKGTIQSVRDRPPRPRETPEASRRLGLARGVTPLSRHSTASNSIGCPSPMVCATGPASWLPGCDHKPQPLPFGGRPSTVR